MECRNRTLIIFVAFLCSSYVYLGTAVDTITAARPIRDSETIISKGSVYKLGFFSPGNSSYRYVGIWFNSLSEAYVWVANRNMPIKDSSGVVTIQNGNLVVMDGQNQVLWSSNVSNSVSNASAQLTDAGNLVLKDNESGRILWDSFHEPTDSLLVGMQLTSSKSTGPISRLTPWKNPSDPSPGSFSAGIDPGNIPQAYVWNDNSPYWRSGPWNGQVFVGIPDMYSIYIDGYKLAVDDQSGLVNFSYSALNNVPAYLVLTSKGILERREWNTENKIWEIGFGSQETECDIYGLCGEFGNCNPKKKPICSCVNGFEPKNVSEWNLGNWTGGCVRKRPLECVRINQTGEVTTTDGFLKLRMMKVPDFAERSSVPIETCREQCLNNCSCVAYAYDHGIGCMIWAGGLYDLQTFSSDGEDLYIRLSHLELGKKRSKVAVIVPVVVVGILTLAICLVFLWRRMKKRKDPKGTLSVDLDNTEVRSEENLSEVKLQDLPMFSFEKLAIATNDFHLVNKLGQGGFGPVYKGELEDGKAVAVKRLSNASGQGLHEFMNEVMVISKLQHRNLVRLLGCCVDKEEKILIYEYMPNKSLDAFLFDPSKQKFLDWRKRFNIIEGISRGLLYLHRDSILKIIHRDLKPSNILLDEEFNPKISDFGMARIFGGGNEDQANTIRVVGTYGYMSPEYVIEGRFSEKSDVFSFGVLLLEIISTRRNSSFYKDGETISLLGHAWKLWNENKISGLIDPAISDPRYQSEISRCVHVGLLSVQEFAKDRPTMSTVVSMLTCDIFDLPAPKQPAFIERQDVLEQSSEQIPDRCSRNNVTITVLEGR